MCVNTHFLTLIENAWWVNLHQKSEWRPLGQRASWSGPSGPSQADGSPSSNQRLTLSLPAGALRNSPTTGLLSGGGVHLTAGPDYSMGGRGAEKPQSSTTYIQKRKHVLKRKNTTCDPAQSQGWRHGLASDWLSGSPGSLGSLVQRLAQPVRCRGWAGLTAVWSEIETWDLIWIHDVYKKIKSHKGFDIELFCNVLSLQYVHR